MIFPTGKPHVSYSEVKTWKECSWRHKLIYVDKIDMFKPSPNIDFGTLVHAECEEYLDKRTFNLERLESNIRKTWEEKKFGSPDSWIKEAKQILKDAGYFTDNLWSIEDVKDICNCSNEEAQDVLNIALTNEGTMHHIWTAIRIAGEDKSLVEL